MKSYPGRKNLHSGQLFLFLDERAGKALVVNPDGKRILVNFKLLSDLSQWPEEDFTAPQIAAFAEFEARENAEALNEEKLKIEYQTLMQDPYRTFKLLAHWGSVTGELQSELIFLYSIGNKYIFSNSLTSYERSHSESLLKMAIRRGFHSGICAPWEFSDIHKKVS